MHRLTTILFFSATLAKVKGMPGRALYARDGCNVNQVTHCCQEMTTTDDAHAIQILHDLGFPIDSNAVVVGKKCTEHDGNNWLVAGYI